MLYRVYDTGTIMSCYTKLKDLPPLQNIQALTVHSAIRHDISPLGLIHCVIVLGGDQFINTFIVCKNLQKELIVWLEMQQVHCLGGEWTENGHMFLH